MKIFQINTFNGSQKLFTIVLASLLATTTLAACTNPFSSNSSQADEVRRGRDNPNNPACTNSTTPDVMGYHDAREIPNYWAYANNFVLQDQMFEPNASWSLPEHLFMVSEWSAKCTQPGNPMS